MKNLLLPLVTFLLFSCAEKPLIKTAVDEWKVYYLGGQSNMDGYGYNNELPESLNIKFANVMIFDGKRVNDNKPDGGIGKWSPLEPGHGVGFNTDGKSNFLSDRFGPELSFAKRLSSHSEKIAIIKYSFGGTALYQGAGYGNWDPDFNGNNHYDNAVATIQNSQSIADINGDGVMDKLIPSGIIWMQGEADAQYSQKSAHAYFDNLKHLMRLFRKVFNRDEMPIVIGKINDSFMTENNKPTQPFISVVHAAQEAFVNQDPCSFYVTETENYTFSSDAWHYNSEGYIKMGNVFANSIIKLDQKCK